MNYQTKQIVVNALIKVVESAPRWPIQSAYPHQNNDISEQEFVSWITYVHSVLDIAYQDAGLIIVLPVKTKISMLSNQNGLQYIQRVFQIKDEILRLAQAILQYP